MTDALRLLVGGFRRPLILWAVALAGLAFVLTGAAQPVSAATIVVDTATDEDTSNASCSLREAISAANTDAAYNGCAAGSGADTIELHISGTALTVRTITLSNSLGALPSITTPLTVDGWSQGVYDGTAGYIGSPLIEVNGTSLTATSIAGLTVDGTSANGVTIQGLTINRFKSSLSAAIKVQNGASNVTIKGNYVGLNSAGTATAAASPNNNSFGILVTDSTTTSITIGGTTSAERNAIAGTNGAGTNHGAGIAMQNGANNVTITGNYIGLRADGTAAVANSTYGILMTDATTTNVTIGGTTAGARNVISGNTSGGIRIQGGATYATVKGNYVGLNAAGTAGISNGTAGINVTGAGTGYVTIGGTSVGDRNIVSGNSSIGIAAQTSASHVTIQGNYVGTDPAGTSAISNSNGIVALSATDTSIGGTATGAGNLVSGNTSSGILVSGTLTNTVVQGNLVGTDASGTAVIVSGGTGIGYSAAGGSGVTFGGTTAAARNVIVGVTTGINLSTGLVSNTTIQGNYVGVMPNGTTAAGNGTGLKMIGATGIVIGGTATGAGNIIANSTGSTSTTGKGIIITGAGASVLIRGNSIYNNGTSSVSPQLGIDLNDDGVTANDPGDADTGPNGRLNFPVLTSAVVGGATRVTGTLNSAASTTYQIDVYANDSCDPSGYGEGKTYLGSTSVTTDSSGNGSFALNSLPVVSAGQIITAAASDTTLGLTSEFSACQTVVASAITVTPTSGLVTTEAGGTTTFSVQLTDAPSASVTIGVSSSNTAEGTVSPSTLTFHADATGADPQMVTVTGANDGIKDGDTLYTVLLAAASSSDGAYSGTDPADVSVTNQDDEGAPTLSVANVQAAEGNGGTSSLTLTVSLAPGSLQQVTVEYVTSGGTATGGAGCGTGVDYVTAAGALTFVATETSKPVPITVCGDALNEPDETFTLTLSNPANALIGQATATGTMQNDDGVPGLAVASSQAAEGTSGTSPLTFTVTLGATSGQTVTVQYTTSNGTATGGASCSAGVDYLTASGTLTFSPGEASRQVPVAICGDTFNEADETLTLSLSSPANAAISQATATGIIQNDDVLTGLTVTGGQVVEGNSGATPLTFTVTLDAGSGQVVTVQYSTSNGTATGGVACGSGLDYVTAGGALTFAPGETSKQVPVAVCGDTLLEPDKMFTLMLSSPVNAAIVQGTATGTIQNDDVVVACSPRPAITVNQHVRGGKLLVQVATSLFNSSQANPLQQLQFGTFRNARVTVDGRPVSASQTVSLPAGSTSADITVERVVAGQDTTVPFTVVDGCGPWNTFVGGGTGAGF